MENGMQMTLEGCMPETFQKQIAGASDSHVRTSPLQENSLDFKGRDCKKEANAIWQEDE